MSRALQLVNTAAALDKTIRGVLRDAGCDPPDPSAALPAPVSPSRAEAEQTVKKFGKLIGLLRGVFAEHRFESSAAFFSECDALLNGHLQSLSQSPLSQEEYSNLLSARESLEAAIALFSSTLQRLESFLNETVSMRLTVPGQAPDFTAVDASTGSTVSLSSLLEGDPSAASKGPMLLVFLRHFAWVPWRQHVHALQANLEWLKARHGLSIYLVSFNDRENALKWNSDNGTETIPHLSDPSKSVFQSFGLTRSLVGVFNFKALCFYADELLAGRKLPHSVSSTDDVFQMGGDFIIAPDSPAPINPAAQLPQSHQTEEKKLNQTHHALVGRVLMAHYSKDSLDRPSVEAIQGCLEEYDASIHRDHSAAAPAVVASAPEEGEVWTSTSCKRT